MPDIAMCASTDCPLRLNCYRHAASGTVPTPERQSYVDWRWHFLTIYETESARQIGAQCLGFILTDTSAPDPAALRNPPAPTR